MYKVLDNFLNQREADEIENLLLSNNFAWWYQPSTVVPTGIESEEYISWPGVRHNFMFNEQILSDALPIVMPLFNRFKDVEKNIKLISMKANLNMPVISSRNVYNIPHVDQMYLKDNFTGVYYVNDSDGDTIIFKEKYNGNDLRSYNLNIDTKVSPRKNRFVFWDSRTYHAAPICNTTPRVVLNINVEVI